MLAVISLLLALAFGAGPAFAFDMLDVRQLRDSGYRWCRKCDLSDIQLQGGNLRRAQLQGANLSHAGLQGADLSYAGLQGAVLYEAQLTHANLNAASLSNADLRGAQLQGVDLSYAQLQRANLASAVLRGAKLIGAQLTRARLGSAQLKKADLSGAQLQNADLVGTQLQKGNLSGAHLQNANMVGTRLQKADLSGAQLQGANMGFADLEHADLSGTHLQNANLFGAQLQNAILIGAELQNADLSFASVEGAKLASADLTGAFYSPASPPPSSYVAGIAGLSTVRVTNDELAQQAEVSGLVSLRELLQRAGYRDLEREATYSIERARTRTAFAAWPGDPLRALEGVLRFVAFELTTAYGLYPGRALLILLGLMLLLSFVYLSWIRRQGRTRQHRGPIYRIWPSERLVEDGQGVRLVTYGDVPGRQRAERLQAKTTLGRYGYALWFSLLSAFHIGWRELSIGTWLSRLQPREYALRAQGWPRFISGMQSLISVYLVAIWALTYFGRPFQ